MPKMKHRKLRAIILKSEIEKYPIFFTIKKNEIFFFKTIECTIMLFAYQKALIQNNHCEFTTQETKRRFYFKDFWYMKINLIISISPTVDCFVHTHYTSYS